MGNRVQKSTWEVKSRLADLGLLKEDLISIVKGCLAGHSGCTDNDPPGAPGYESWRMGVRRAREVLRAKGWEKNDENNFPTVVNEEKKIRIAILNTDSGTGTIDRVPQNRSKKGPHSERVATANEQLTLPSYDEWDIPVIDKVKDFDNYATWHLCVYIGQENGKDVISAELSILTDFTNGFFKGFSEKIIILAPGEWDTIYFGDSNNDDDDGQDFDISVVRK